MPEYLAPGVFVEEVSYRSKSIEGVPTSTTGFAGLTHFGPVRYDGGPLACEPRLVTSYAEFERIYGGLTPLGIGGRIPYLAHAARAFFLNGGRRLARTAMARSPPLRCAAVMSDCTGPADRLCRPQLRTAASSR